MGAGGHWLKSEGQKQNTHSSIQAHYYRSYFLSLCCCFLKLCWRLTVTQTGISVASADDWKTTHTHTKEFSHACRVLMKMLYAYIYSLVLPFINIMSSLQHSPLASEQTRYKTINTDHHQVRCPRTVLEHWQRMYRLEVYFAGICLFTGGVIYRLKAWILYLLRVHLNQSHVMFVVR